MQGKINCYRERTERVIACDMKDFQYVVVTASNPMNTRLFRLKSTKVGLRAQIPIGRWSHVFIF